LTLKRTDTAFVATGPAAEFSHNDRGRLAAEYQAVRRQTAALCVPLAIEDYVVQSMPDASPTKWHLAHTAWFFETFVLAAARADYRPINQKYTYIFNSYYNAVGDRTPRSQRGALSRPTVAEVKRYRSEVDARMLALIDQIDAERLGALAATIVLGLNHEQQHQELILTDIKHVFGSNPLRPVYAAGAEGESRAGAPARWRSYSEGLREIGHSGTAFAFDNERPRHRVFVAGFQVASRLVTCGEYLTFLADKGYERPELWLSDGWDARRASGWDAPLYWERHADRWEVMTLAGLRPLNEHEPVCHVSYYEADAFARWTGARLPTEAEWETAADGQPIAGNFLETGRFHPAAAAGTSDSDVLPQLFGDVWEWTQSPYASYPGFRPAPGALGEYNGKFMCNQFVLRGGSCATPQSHIRPTYRNFFPASARWQFTGIRLAKDAGS
jgi:ergothioneine biosynthesis protein EgtB